MTSVFVGHFSSKESEGSVGSSSAGNQVQREILRNMLVCASSDVRCFSMNPSPFWPHGKIIIRGVDEGIIEFMGYINLPVIKHLHFSVRLLIKLIGLRPRMVLLYNSYFFENLAVLCYRIFEKSAYLALIIQDVNIVRLSFSLSKAYLQSIPARLSLFSARWFSFIVPISDAIISDFGFDSSRCFVFKGGGTTSSEHLNKYQQAGTAEIAVFAGALESYNGIDKLLDQWISSRVKYTIHVFGKGALSTYVDKVAKEMDKVVYHGHQPQDVVQHWQGRARWNFCLRYSIKLEQRYFFPSKFFNICCAPGSVVVNDFYGLPESLRAYINIVSDDLKNLDMILSCSRDGITPYELSCRREVVNLTHSWRYCLETVFSKMPAS